MFLKWFFQVAKSKENGGTPGETYFTVQMGPFVLASSGKAQNPIDHPIPVELPAKDFTQLHFIH